MVPCILRLQSLAHHILQPSVQLSVLVCIPRSFPLPCSVAPKVYPIHTLPCCPLLCTPSLPPPPHTHTQVRLRVSPLSKAVAEGRDAKSKAAAKQWDSDSEDEGETCRGGMGGGGRAVLGPTGGKV